MAYFPIDPDKIKSLSFVLLFNRNTAPYVIDAYRSAEAGDSSGFALMSLAFNQMMPTMFVWGDFLAKGYSADFDSDRDYSELSNFNSIMGSPLSGLFWPVIDNWTMTLLSPSYRHVTPSTVKTLLVSGNIDFSTPFEYAEQELLPMLENGRQLILTDMGHPPY